MKRCILLALIATSCGTQEMAQSWQIDRMRILAVRSSVLDENGMPTQQAEPQPGDTVVLSSLTVHPDIEGPQVIWTGCVTENSSLFGCTPPEGEDGFLGIEPFFPPSLSVPADLLDGLTEEEKQEGLSYLFTLIAVPDVEELGDDFSPDDFTQDEEIATKYMPVSLADTPNNNPFINQILIEKVPIATGATVRVTPGQTYQFEPVLAFGPEEYSYLNSSGEVEERTEEPYFSWYATEGRFDSPFSNYEDFTTVNWTAPKEPTRSEAKIWIVVRDQRGGMGWAEQVVRFE